MSYTGNPATSIIDRVRLYVGDIDDCELGLTDEVYEYVIDKNQNVDGSPNEARAAVECLKYLVAKYASYVTEKAGGLFIKESEKFEQYRRLLDLFTKDPRTAIIQQGLPYAGGISWDDYCTNLANPDARKVVYKELQYEPIYSPFGFKEVDSS